MIRILIVEKQTLFGKALSALLACEADLEVIGDVCTIEETNAYAGCADVVLLDFNNYDIPVYQWVGRVRSASHAPHLCVIAEHFSLIEIERCLEADIEGLVLKSVLPADLMQAIRMVAQGEAYVDPKVAGALLRRRMQTGTPPISLTVRETEVVRLIADGLSNREIGIRLTLSEKTVKSHLGRIFSKLKISGRTRAAVHAIKTGLA